MANAITDNHFLARLPQDSIERISRGLEWVEMPAGDMSVLDTLESIFFPVEGLVSFVSASNSGTTSEVALAGSESLVGLCIFMNCKQPLIPAVVQRSVIAAKIPARLALEEFRRSAQFQQSVLDYMRIFFNQVVQLSLCNAQHSLEQRFCRWLLMSKDRLNANEQVAMSQELIAGNLGVRREAVTRVATQLKSRKIIDYTTRRIEIVDRDGLKAAACECYESLRSEFEEFIG